jgi:hypothetical protein
MTTTESVLQDTSKEQQSDPPAASPRGGFEWKSRTSLFGIPLIHVVFGSDTEGRTRVAKGFIAVGQIAVGAIAVGQVAIGVVFGLGQVAIGLVTLGQAALGILLGVGQFSTGLIAVGQFCFGLYGIGSTGWAKYAWFDRRVDMEAVALAHTILLKLRLLFGLGAG